MAQSKSETYRDMLSRMWLIRLFEERVIELCHRNELAGLVHVGIGQEGVAVGVAVVYVAGSHSQKKSEASDIRSAYAFLQDHADQFSFFSRRPQRLVSSLAVDDVASALAFAREEELLESSLQYIARVLQTPEDRENQEQRLVGTPAYMSPEQANRRKADARR